LRHKAFRGAGCRMEISLPDQLMQFLHQFSQPPPRKRRAGLLICGL